MEDMIYVWGDNLAYCSREGLEDMIQLVGEDYESLTPEEYYTLYPGDDK